MPTSSLLVSPLHCHPPTPRPTTTTATRGLLVPGAGSPVVKRVPTTSSSGADHRWLLWYHSGNGISLASSRDGLHWQLPSASTMVSLLPSTDWWVFDTAAVRPSDVLVVSNPAHRAASAAVYWLYYTGCRDGSFAEALPGLAISQDGRHWARVEGEHHTGALLGVEEDSEVWETRCVAAPKVVLHGDGDLRMYYHSFDEMSQRHAIGLTRSSDGIRWVRVGKVLEGGGTGSFDAGGVRHGHAVRDRAAGRYVMAYEGVDTDGRVSIGMALSDDGLKGWRRCGNAPVLCSSEEDDGWDGAGVGSPCLVQMDGPDEWRLYYMGIGRDGGMAIGMAYSEGQGLQKFEKCDSVLM